MKTPNIAITRDKRRTDPIKSGGVSYPKNRGGFDVFVDGKLWGRTQQCTHGCHGSTHELLQLHSDGVCRNAYEVIKSTSRVRNDRHVAIRIWSDKQYLRHLKPGEVAMPLEDRIKAMAADAIKGGWLRDPAVIAADAKKKADAARANEAKRLQEREDMWNNKADETIGIVCHARLTPIQFAELKARIVAAMKWAQTQ